MTLAEQIDKLGATALEIKAQRDRYEKALREIAGDGPTTEQLDDPSLMCICFAPIHERRHNDCCPVKIAQEALRCE